MFHTLIHILGYLSLAGLVLAVVAAIIMTIIERQERKRRNYES